MNFLAKNYLVVGIALVLIALFVFDKNGLIARMQLNAELADLKVQRQYYLDRIAEDSMLLEDLKSDIFLEKYARERYLMKKKSETIYLIEE